jgi:hypothetical protein
MKFKLPLFLIFVGITMLSKAQTRSKKYYRDCTNIKNYYAYKGDTVIFNCDSIRLYNLPTFENMQKAYNRLYNTSNELVLKTDSASLIFKNLYEEKSRAYEVLQQSYSQFRQNTENHILATDSNMLVIKNNTLNAKIQLEKADSFIVSGMEKIEKFNNNLWKMKLKYAGIGFLGGLITGGFLVVMF